MILGVFGYDLVVFVGVEVGLFIESCSSLGVLGLYGVMVCVCGDVVECFLGSW